MTVLWIPRSIQMEKVALGSVQVARACEVTTLERMPVAEATDLGEIASAGACAQEGAAKLDYRRWTNTQGQRQFHLPVAAWCCRPTKIQVSGDAGSSLRKPRSAGSGRFVSM